MSARSVNTVCSGHAPFSGVRLDDWRVARGWTYSDLARALSISPPAARRYCLGLRMPTPTMLAAIRRVTAGAITADSFLPDPPPPAALPSLL